MEDLDAFREIRAILAPLERRGIFWRLDTNHSGPSTCDYTKRFNSLSILSLRGAKFFGGDDDFIVKHYDDSLYILNKKTTNIVKEVQLEIYHSDRCVAPYPSIYMIALIEEREKLTILSPLD